jgi:hypothetical protein
MARRMIGAVAFLMVLLVLLVGWTALAAQAGAVANEPGSADQPPENRRERQDSPAAAEISFIDDPSPACYRPEPHTDSCFISWSYLSVSAASSQYIISMTVAIDGRLVAAHWGFFQSSMYVPGDLYNGGFQVPCGAPGTTGVRSLGGAHSYVVRARETGGLKAANYGTVVCPAGLERVFLPVTLRSAPPAR